MSAPSAVQLTCLPAPLVVHQDLPVHRKCLISGKSHSKWGWFQKSTWRRDSCGHSLEWELASSLGKTYLGLFFCMDVHHFLRVLSFSFSENFNIYVQKARKIFPLLQGPFYHLWNPHESSLSEYTGGMRGAQPELECSIDLSSSVSARYNGSKNLFISDCTGLRRKISLRFFTTLCFPRRPWEKQLHWEAGNCRQVAARAGVHTHMYVPRALPDSLQPEKMEIKSKDKWC